MGEVNEAQAIRTILEKLVSDLKCTWNALQEGSVPAELKRALHNDQGLPNKELAAVASEAVNLLHTTEQLLEPAQLVLADHFLGKMIILTAQASTCSSGLAIETPYQVTPIPNASAQP